MVFQDLGYVFDSLDVECKGYIEWFELQQFDKEIYHETLDIEQLEAAIKTVCGNKSNGKCTKEYFPDIVKEIDRRHVMEEQIRWDFCSLDVEKVGRISIQSALFLFKAVLGERFSKRCWKRFLDNRVDSFKDIYFDEIKVYLCSIPDLAAADSERDYDEQNRVVGEYMHQNMYNTFKELEDSLNDDTLMAAKERAKQVHSIQIKNKAYHLLNRMDEIGMQALLEDDYNDGSSFEGRPKDHITASDLIDVLNEKYQVLRDKLLLEMLQDHFGMSMWQALSEFEQQEKLYQLKIKEEKLRKESHLEEMAKHLPGSGIGTSYNLFTLMGESAPEMEIRIQEQEEIALKDGRSYEDVESDFIKKLAIKDKERSSSELILIAINNRYELEKDYILRKLQGLGGYSPMDAKERENQFFSYMISKIRGIQAKSLYSCAISIGLSERIDLKQYNLLTDKVKHNQLSVSRVKAFRQRYISDEFNIPPKLFLLKSKLGRVDLEMQLLQEVERMFALEREALLDFMFSREYLHFRISAKRLTREEKISQLKLLYSVWENNSSKSESEKPILNRKCLQEAVALKFELLFGDMANSNDMSVASHLLTCLQLRQDEECQKFINVGCLGIESLTSYWKAYTQSIIEENFKCIASIVFGIADELADDEKEIIKVLEKKYDVLRDKFMMEALMNQFGKAEWDKLSEQERQNELFKLKLLEKKLKREGKYDELSKLLDDSSHHSETLNKLLGQNRKQYLDKLNERLKDRQRRIALGENVEDIEDNENELQQGSSTGNVLKDLDKRFDDEKDALLQRLRDQHDMNEKERERHSQLLRLKLEARRAAKENNLDGAALVLGLAERNKANLSDRLKNDRKRQEQLAKERLAARKKKISFSKDTVESQPSNDDLNGWQDFVINELERKHEKERNMFFNILEDEETKSLRNDARQMNEDARNKQLIALKAKKDDLDLETKSDQEEHIAILEMAAAIKYAITESFLKENSDEILTKDGIIVSIMADLQQVQDVETENLLNSLPNKSFYDLLILRNKYIEEQNQCTASNISKVIFTLIGGEKEEELLKAVDKKYDILMDKLTLEALQKQMGNAAWLQLSEKERQAKMMRLRLQQKQLLKDGKFDEAARLLGDGFQVETNIQILMDENKKKQNDILQKRLEQYRQKLAKGEDPGEMPTSIPENAENIVVVDGKTLFEDLQKRHEKEKEALLNRLRGVDSQYLTEKERQAELAKLKRQQRRVQQEEKFGAASLVFGIAEKNKATAQEKFDNDRQRQEQLAKERLERLKSKKKSSFVEPIVCDNEKELHESLFVAVEQRHAFEREDLVKLFQNISLEKIDETKLFSFMTQRMFIEYWKQISLEVDKFPNAVNEMAVLKFTNKMNSMKLTRNSQDEILISILADLQQCQDQEVDDIMKSVTEMDENKINEMKEKERLMCQQHFFPNISLVLSIYELNINDSSIFINGLLEKFVALEDKLIMNGLEQKFGKVAWKTLDWRDQYSELLKVKKEQKRLNDIGKTEDAKKMLNDLVVHDNNCHVLLGLTYIEEEERLMKATVKFKKLNEEGKTKQEIKEEELIEYEKSEKKLMEKSTGILNDLKEICEAEKKTLLTMLESKDPKINTQIIRQLKLARLWHTARQTFLESNYNTAVLRILTSKCQEISFSSKINNDRHLQEKLAKKRLDFFKDGKYSEEEQMLRESYKKIEAGLENDLLILQDVLLYELERKHISERDYLCNLIHPEKESIFKKKKMLPQHCNARLVELKELYEQCQKGHYENPQNILEEAFHLKIKENDCDDLGVEYLSDLQDIQDAEVEQVFSELVDKSVTMLKQFINIQQVARQNKIFKNVGIILFEEQAKKEEDELVQALKEKYDAIKMKLYEEALKKKFGEETWESMTSQEKSKYLAKLKAEELLIGGQRELDLLNLQDMGVLMSNKNAEDGEENKEVKGKELIKDLQIQFEKEKEAVLEMIKKRDIAETNERGRQLELCRLRQEKKRIQREDKLNGAALLFTMTSQNEKNSQQRIENERARQQQLAKQRILACRERKQKEIMSLDEVLDSNEKEDAKDDMISIEQIQREGTVALQDSLLLEIEKKHASEREALVEMFEGVEIFEKATSDDEIFFKLQAISVDRKKLIKKSMDFLSVQQPDFSSEIEKTSYNESLLQHHRSCLDILKKGLMLRLALQSFKEEDPCVFFMTKLQEQQMIETNSTMKIMLEINRETLKRLKDEHRKARRGGWMDNIAILLFDKKETSPNEEIQKEFENEEEQLKLLTDAQIKELEKEIEKEKQTVLSSLTKDEVDNFMKELKERENLKRMGIEEQANRQRKAAQQRLEEKRRKREEKTYENDLAHAMLANAEKRNILLREKTLAAQGVHKDELEERLRLRREERKKKQDIAEKEEKEAENSKAKTLVLGEEDKNITPELSENQLERSKSLHLNENEPVKKLSEDLVIEKEPEVKPKKVMPPLPGGGMKREKTVVEKAAEISENKKKDMINVLMREQTSIAKKINREQERQEELVRELREKRRKKMEAREMEAAAVIGLGARQKTIVEDRKKDERERQIEQIRERVNRIKSTRSGAKDQNDDLESTTNT
ncbi:trichohyalin isoform X1 [Hydra vulgaris]|uniref:trichohyalin isoform X1 n=1 Tax=Hydra vulgaris TaxID=6087 RepID=UPI001F5E721A|nr:trichohyalin [Hydra vulgaris]